MAAAMEMEAAGATGTPAAMEMGAAEVETAIAVATEIPMAADAAAATETPAGMAVARQAAQETATTATPTEAALAAVPVTETPAATATMEEAEAAEVAMPAIRGMLAATGTATTVGMATAMEAGTVAAMRAMEVRAAATETVVGTAMVRPAVAQEMATAVAKPTLTPGV
jgi:hypothetical protein